MLRRFAFLFLLFAPACGDGGLTVPADDAGVDAIPCVVTPIASVTGLCNSYPIPLPFASPDVSHMVVYVDGVALSADTWTSNGHAVTITSCVEGDKAQHLVAVSFGCGA